MSAKSGSSSRGGSRSRSGASRDVFPQTQMTWVCEQLESGAIGRSEVNRHIMSVYAHPLKVYFLGSSFRNLGEPDDIVQGFFASRLERPTFFEDWRQSGKPLRRWLMNALIFYLKETWRKEHSREMEEINPSDHPDNGHALTHSYDRAWVQSIVAEACKQASAACSEAGQDDHWMIFHRHYVLDQEYAEIAPDYGITSAQATVMARTARNKFRRALRDSVMRDGVGHGSVDEEISRLLETL